MAKSRKLYGRTPTELLEQAGLLGPDVLLAHCLFSSDGDLDIARRHDATVINCPRTFARGGATAAFGPLPWAWACARWSAPMATCPT